jgi:hypothetical protein
MSAVPRPIRRRPAKRPATRTVEVVIKSGDFEGWEATARADFPAKLLADLESGQIGKIITVLDAIIVSHNFPNADDEIAASMGDVDPYPGLMKVAGEIFDEIAKLPNR